MPRKRASMRKIREVLRLKWERGLSERQIAKSCRLSRSTIHNYVGRAQVAGLSWPLPEAMDDEMLEDLLFPESEAVVANETERSLPDWAEVHKELKGKGVTLFLLWQEYKLAHKGGYEYSSFTLKYRQWCKDKNLSMHQQHKAGEKIFVDYAGMTIGITDPATGEAKEAQVFVAVLGASNYSYVEASWTQKLADWLGAHRRALEFFAGVPEIVVPDNLRTGVRSPCYYEPELNPSYAEFAEHYGVAIIPARVRKPRDKAKVESGVQIVERHILAPLRKRTFFSLHEANKAIRMLLDKLNRKPFQKLPGSRLSYFQELDQPALRPLPKEPYVLAHWKKAKVNINYHIEVSGHYYSVPYQYVKHKVDIRYTQTTVEVFHKAKRIASHQRVFEHSRYKHRYITLSEHMPPKHRHQAEWTPQRLINWAQKTGQHTATVVEIILKSKPHPQQGFRSCLGILRLAQGYSAERLEAACCRAHHLGSYSFHSIQSILKHQLDLQPLPEDETMSDKPQTHQRQHSNVRGAAYYQEKSSSKKPSETKETGTC